MNDNKQFLIPCNGQLVPVTDEVYCTYYKMIRRERYLEESDATHGKILYSDMDTGEITGEETIPDLDSIPIEESAIKNALLEQLRNHLDSLSDNEREIMDALFFSNNGEGMTEREYSEISGIPQKTINDRKRRILIKLKKLLES